ncbi:MAG: hypothetical protein IT429_17400 [Gemmataceae bacterium]|nr:hypothetical protein [Gemmataceae bacterium]
MQAAYRGAALGVVGLLLLPLAQGTGRTQEKTAGAVELKVVRYDGLADEISRHRGKVVVVDFWADY